MWNLEDVFRRVAARTSKALGSPWAFVVAFSVVAIWAVSGPVFHFSDTWQLVINTGTTIVTFLMVFVIQNTQNRDSEAMHLKIDELIRVEPHARDWLAKLESLEDHELAALKAHFDRLAARAREDREL